MRNFSRHHDDPTAVDHSAADVEDEHDLAGHPLDVPAAPHNLPGLPQMPPLAAADDPDHPPPMWVSMQPIVPSRRTSR